MTKTRYAKEGGMPSKLLSLAMSIILAVTLTMPSGLALAEAGTDATVGDPATLKDAPGAGSESAAGSNAEDVSLSAGLKVRVEAEGAAEGATAVVRVEAVEGDPNFAPIEREVPANADAVVAEAPALAEGATYSVGVVEAPAAAEGEGFDGGEAYTVTLAEDLASDDSTWGEPARHVKAPDEADRDDVSVTWTPVAKEGGIVRTDLTVSFVLEKHEREGVDGEPVGGGEETGEGDVESDDPAPEAATEPDADAELDSPVGKDKEEAAAALAARMEVYSNAVSPRSSSVTHVGWEDSMTEGGWTQKTRYMEIDGQFALCCTHFRDTPPEGSPATVIGTVTNDDMRKVAWYGWGGPGSLGYSLVETACMLSNANGDTPVVSVNDRLNYIRTLASPPSSFVLTKWSTGGVTQDMITWTYKPNGYLHFQKNSSNPEITNGNDCYTLAGAVYNLYKADGTYVRSITTPASGYVDLGEVEAGSYYFVEQTAPTGYHLSSTPIWVTVVSEQTATATTSDVPYDDPIYALLHKYDSVTGGTAQANSQLAGAEFTVKFYAGNYASGVDPATLGVDATRSWIMKTDKDGFCYFDASYVISGSPFYLNQLGSPTFPLGTVTVQETKAPEGYLLSTPSHPNNVFVQRITTAGIDGGSAEVWNEHEFLDDAIRGGVKTAKLDSYHQSATAQGDGTMQGAVFAIKNVSLNPVLVDGIVYEPGKDVATITSGADGVAKTSSDLLPYGAYELRETAPPEGYLLSDEVWRFEIVENGVVVEATTEQSIDNQVIRGGVKTAKIDHQSQTSVPQGSASVQGAVFAIKNVSSNPVLVDGIVYEPGKDVATITSGADGVAKTASDLLPYGTYELRETVPPEGYLLSDEVWRFEIREDGKVVEATTEQAIDDQVKAAECFIIKVGTKIGDDVTEGDKAEAIPLPGVEFSIYASKDFVDNGDGTYTVRNGADPYATVVTDENGIADTSYNPRPDDQHGALPYDDYLVIETGPKPNYDPIDPFTFSAREDKKVYHFFANNTYVTSGVELVKVDAESGLPVLVAGTQLQVLDASKTPIVWHETYPEAISYDTLTVGDTGRVYLPQKLNAGSYYLREVSAPEGYLLGHADVPFAVSVTTDWDNPLVVEYANMPQKGSIKIMKVDAETGMPVPAAGIEFDLVAASDIKTGDGVVHVPAGDVAAKLVTGADGTATAKDLYLGSYRVVETLAPEGYVLNGEPVDVVLSYAGQEVEAAYAEAEFGDVPQKGVIEVSKVDAESGLPVAVPGIELRVTAAADVVTPDGTVRAHAGDVVAEVTTGEDGKAETPELYLGKYEVVETLAPDGYILNSEPVEVELVYADQEVAVTRAGAVVSDAPQKGIIEIVKTDEADGRAVPGAVYEVTAAADVATPDGTVHASSGDVVATVVTGDDGKAETDELYLGEYNVRETATPDGWAIDRETHKVVLEYAGQEVEVTRTVFETADAPTVFKLMKKAEQVDGELVDYEGSEWRVWAEDAAGEVAYEAVATTGEDGCFVLERIPHGDGLTYYCQETKTGDDYILEPEVYEFAVDVEGMIAGEPMYVLANTNYHKRIIEASKSDEDTGAPVGETGFALYRWIGEGEPDPTFGGREDSHGVFAENPDGEVDESLWEAVAEGTTDDMGSVIFEGLEFGWYMLVETVPNPDYAEWWESAGSTWGRYLIKADKLSDVRQTQAFGNMAISLECNVSKATIDRTSAAFQSGEWAPVRVDNVGKERYRYDIAFDAGSTNVRADQYAVVDPCEFTALGIRLDTLVTPVVYGDTDGLVNVWYRTNATDASAVYSTASATAGNPENQMADGTDRIGTVGWRLWREGVAAGARTRLDVSGLGLADGEHVTGIMLEYGSVEVGFRTLQDMSYLVYATEPLDNSDGEVVIPNSVTSHITRNWRDGRGLYDDARDDVFTRVIDTFGFSSSYHGLSWGAPGRGAALTSTGDGTPVMELLAMCLAAVLAVLLGVWATRREEGGEVA